MDDLIEIDEKQHLRREEAAARLHALADALARHNSVDFERDGRRITARVPDEVDLKIEFEVDDDGAELEIELTW
jgi:amphi-Trp domain-containing protein